MNKAELVEAVQKALGKDTSKATAERAVEAVIESIKGGLKKRQSRATRRLRHLQSGQPQGPPRHQPEDRRKDQNQGVERREIFRGQGSQIQAEIVSFDSDRAPFRFVRSGAFSRARESPTYTALHQVFGKWECPLAFEVWRLAFGVWCLVLSPAQRPCIG